MLECVSPLYDEEDDGNGWWRAVFAELWVDSFPPADGLVLPAGEEED